MILQPAAFEGLWESLSFMIKESTCRLHTQKTESRQSLQPISISFYKCCNAKVLMKNIPKVFSYLGVSLSGSQLCGYNTDSQNGWGWKGLLDIIWSKFPPPAGTTTADRPAPYSGGLLVSPRRKKTQPYTIIANPHLIKEPHITIEIRWQHAGSQMKNMTRMLMKEAFHGELSVHRTLYVHTAHDSRLLWSLPLASAEP